MLAGTGDNNRLSTRQLLKKLGREREREIYTPYGHDDSTGFCLKKKEAAING